MATACFTDRSPETEPAAVPAWLYALFFLSGVSGLMYEVVWLRMLTRLLGHTVYATATVLAAFMAGLALGSFLAGRYSDRARRPLRCYGLLELGIGLAALASLGLPERLLPLYRLFHELAGGSRVWLTVAQVGIALPVLLLPTALMGATLPVLCAYGARRQRAFGRCLGTLYALNTLGAVGGVLAGGFVLIGAVGETNTVRIGAALNGAVAFAALVVGRAAAPASGRHPLPSATIEPARSPACQPEPGAVALYPDSVRRVVLVGFAGAGFAALANEVVWSRLLTLYQGTSVYAFSSLLAVLLLGMGLGSWLGSRWVDRWADPLRQLALVQLAIGLAGLAALHLFAHGALATPDLAAGRNLGVLLAAPVVLVGPLGLLWGLAFPVAARCYMPRRAAAGRSVAHLYAWNTLGGIAGALTAGFGLIPLLGTSLTGTVLAALSLGLGLLLLGAQPRGLWQETPGLRRWGLIGACALLLATVGDPYDRLLRGRIAVVYPGGARIDRHREEAAGTTTAFGAPWAGSRQKYLWVNGHGMTVLATVTKLMAHLPIWLAEEPRDVLVVCFGMGTTARSASRHPGLHVWAVELVPGVLECFGYFHADGPQVLRQPNLHPVVDDGRHFLLMRPRLYDVITVDPAPPLYSAGAVHLYSREFFGLCRDRLRPGGVACLWVPPANESEVKMILRTFLEVFAHVSVWEGPAQQSSLQGLYLLGSHRRLERVAEKIQRAYDQPAVVADLVEWGSECDRPDKVCDLFVADDRALRAWLSDARVITDDRPYTEFPLWRALFDRGGAYHRQLTAPGLRQYLKAAQLKRGPLRRRKRGSHRARNSPSWGPKCLTTSSGTRASWRVSAVTLPSSSAASRLRPRVAITTRLTPCLRTARAMARATWAPAANRGVTSTPRQLIGPTKRSKACSTSPRRTCS
jgi:spermidine synthase